MKSNILKIIAITFLIFIGLFSQSFIYMKIYEWTIESTINIKIPFVFFVGFTSLLGLSTSKMGQNKEESEVIRLSLVKLVYYWLTLLITYLFVLIVT